MGSKIGLGAIILAVLIVAASAPSATATPPTDACPLLTPAEVSAVVGVTVGAGSHMTPTYLKSCTWAPPSGATKDFATLILALESASSFQAAKAMLQAATQSPDNSGKNRLTMTSASGIGDEAFYSSVASYTKLIVKKGDVVFQLVIYGNSPIEKKRDMERALASKVLAKL